MKIKKITSVLMTGIMLMSAVPFMTATASAVESKDFEYDITSAGTAVITDYEGKDTNIVIPGAIDGYQVTAIGGYSFAYSDKVESISIPNGVKSIGNGAFSNCEFLKKVTIPESVTSIRYGAFQYDTNLTDVKLPSKLTSIESNMFSNSGIKSIEIPENVRTIYDNAFSDCEKLESIYIPDGVKEIGSDLCSGCTALSSLRLSKNLRVIPYGAFAKTRNLSAVSIPSKVTKIGETAFAESGIKSVSIGKSVKTIDSEAFYVCPKLTAIKVKSKNKNYSSKSGVLYNKKKSLLITYPAGKKNKTFTLLSKVKKLESYSFSGNSYLENIKFKKGLTSIKKGAFMNTSLKKVKFPKSLKKIENDAFLNCESLESVTIPANVIYINDHAFSECTALKKLNFNGNSKLELGYGVFESCRSLKTVSAPIAKKSQGRLFFACTKINKVKISKNIKKIFREDYAECPNLNKVTIPATVKKIGYHAFGYINYYDYSYDTNDNLVIKGYKNSAAHKYAKENNFTFKKMKS